MAGAQHDYRDARSTWPGASTTAAPTRSVAALAADDGGSGEPSLGDRLQGLVPDHGWSALRSLDGERSPQPVYFAAAGGREARWSARLAGAGGGIPRGWSAGGDPLRQRSALCVDGGRRSRLALCATDQGRREAGEDQAREPPAKWLSRAHASNAEGGYRQPAGSQSTGLTTSFR